MENEYTVDDLAEVREQIRHLRSKEQDIRRRLLTGEIARKGQYFTAQVNQHLVLRPRDATLTGLEDDQLDAD